MLQAGDMIGDIVLVRRLGAGGFGVVWLGEPVSGGPSVALKILHPDLVSEPDGDGPSMIDRLIAEAKTLERLDHPGLVHIVEIIDRREEGLVAYAMERLHGHELGKLAPHLDLCGLLAVFTQVAETLDYVHRHGVIHRDVKLNNIFICTTPSDDAEPLVKLIDFGIAKDRGATNQLPSTRAGILGTLSTTAPESFARGEDDSVEITAAADQWSFGVALYSTLAGHPPFRLNTPLALIEQIMRQAPPPLVLEARFGVASTPPALAALVDRCLQKEPAARFDSAGSLADELRRVLEGLKDRPSLDVSGILSTTMQTGAIALGAQTLVLAVQDKASFQDGKRQPRGADRTLATPVLEDTARDVVAHDAAPTVGVRLPSSEISAPTHIPGVDDLQPIRAANLLVGAAPMLAPGVQVILSGAHTPTPADGGPPASMAPDSAVAASAMPDDPHELGDLGMLEGGTVAATPIDARPPVMVDHADFSTMDEAAASERGLIEEVAQASRSAFASDDAGALGADPPPAGDDAGQLAGASQSSSDTVAHEIVGAELVADRLAEDDGDMLAGGTVAATPVEAGPPASLIDGGKLAPAPVDLQPAAAARRPLIADHSTVVEVPSMPPSDSSAPTKIPTSVAIANVRLASLSPAPPTELAASAAPPAPRSGTDTELAPAVDRDVPDDHATLELDSASHVAVLEGVRQAERAAARAQRSPVRLPAAPTPRRLNTTLMVFLVLLGLAFAIGWLLHGGGQG